MGRNENKGGPLWFFGTGRFAAKCLSLLEKDISFDVVVTSPPAKGGRGLRTVSSPVDEVCSTLEIPVRRSANVGQDDALLSLLKEAPPLAILVVDFGQKIPEDVLHRATGTVIQEGETTGFLSPSDALYRAVLPLLLGKLKEPTSTDELASLFDVSKPQIRKWLERGVTEGKVKKTTRPVRYCAKETNSEGV
jgi:hypothetical protein